MDRHFDVSGIHLDGAREATVTVEAVVDRKTLEETYTVKVKPKGKRTEYALPLSLVAEMVAWRAAKLEARR